VYNDFSGWFTAGVFALAFACLLLVALTDSW